MLQCFGRTFRGCLGFLGRCGLASVLLAMDSPVVRSWMANSVILNRATVGTVCIIPRDYLSRTDVIVNGEILAPIIKFHGLRPSIHAIRSEVAHFFHVGRPLGKSPVQRNSTAWDLAYLVLFLFGPMMFPRSQLFCEILSEVISFTLKHGSYDVL